MKKWIKDLEKIATSKLLDQLNAEYRQGKALRQVRRFGSHNRRRRLDTRILREIFKIYIQSIRDFNQKRPSVEIQRADQVIIRRLANLSVNQKERGKRKDAPFQRQSLDRCALDTLKTFGIDKRWYETIWNEISKEREKKTDRSDNTSVKTLGKNSPDS